MNTVERCGKEYEAYACSKCGEDTVASYSADIRKNMVERRLCFHCNYWVDFLETNPSTIISGCVYVPGNRTSGSMRGMGGRRFDIEYIAGPHEGKKITTFDLWAGSQIPNEYRDQFPDTARFLAGADKHEVGATTCWNPSDPNASKHPSPAQVGIRS